MPVMPTAVLSSCGAWQPPASGTRHASSHHSPDAGDPGHLEVHLHRAWSPPPASRLFVAADAFPLLEATVVDSCWLQPAPSWLLMAIPPVSLPSACKPRLCCSPSKGASAESHRADPDRPDCQARDSIQPRALRHPARSEPRA